MKAIQVQQLGGPAQLQLTDVPDPAAGPDDAIVEVKFCGVNFIDVYFRSGLYKVDLPFIPGNEASGVVHAVGAGVRNVKPGDRVAYAMTRGSYAELARVPAAQLVKIPDSVSFEQAAVACRDPFAVEWIDTRQDYGEERLILLGMVERGVLLVVYTERGDNIRIISARRATKHEQDIYYRQNAP